MDLLNNYIRALRVFLPRHQRDDIVRELAEEIRDQAAEREAALGRPLNVDEQADVLRQHGHPLLTAARYRSQRHLIGPIVFPYYLLALKVVLGLVVAGRMIAAVVLLWNDPSWSQIGAIASELVQNSLAVVAGLTILGAVYEWWLTRSRVLETWDPKGLVSPMPPAAGRAVRQRPGEPASLRGFVIGMVISAWWLLALRFPYLMFGAGAADLAWGPAMDRIYPVLVAVQLTSLAEHYWRLTHPHDARLFRVTRVIWTVAGLALLYVILTVDHNWIVWRDSADAATRTKVLFDIGGRQVSVLDFANYCFSIPFTLAAVGGALSLVRRMTGWFPRGGQPVAAVILMSLLSGAIAVGQTPGDAAIRQILIERIDVQKRSHGIVVGIVSPTGRRIVAHGQFGPDDKRPIDADTLFEIGSVTKVFTSLLLADMSARGEVKLTDPIAQYLPGSSSRASPRVITLADLATHTSGMPFWPSNIPPTAEGAVTLATYSGDQLLQFAASFEPPAAVGTKWAYSNTDAGLLGALLARRAGSTYEVLVRERITTPLKMSSTAIAVAPDQTSRLAFGHNAQLKPAQRWNVPALEGAGSLHSTVNDLLTFLAAAGDPSSIFGRALPMMLATRRQGPGFQQAIGWMILPATPSDPEMLLHDGGTSGFASSIVYDPVSRTGVVVLSNSVNSVADIARHLLRPSLPLAKPPTPAPVRTAIAIDPKLLDRYAGEYVPGPGAVFTVSRAGDSLTMQIPELPLLRLRAESERQFFLPEDTRVTVTFEVSEAGEVTGLVLNAPTGNVKAARSRR